MDPVEPRMAICFNLDHSIKRSGQKDCCKSRAYHSTGAAMSSASMRSNTPPCPGSNVPESFTPAPRLIADSTRSPSCAATFRTAASTSHPVVEPGNDSSEDSLPKLPLASHPASSTSSKAVSTLPATEATAPSQVLPGLIDGASFLHPK